MFRYADPEACPVCRAAVPYAATRCEACSTALSDTTAQSLFRTLTHADRLVSQLRAAATAVPGPTAASAATPVGVPQVSAIPPDQPAFPVPQRPGAAQVPRTSGLSSASVPRILLGLGATCLLVAALVFLAVAWTVLGVGGRTVTLVLITAAAGGATAWLVGKDLRGGAEALASVTAGLVVLDLFGVRAAGWLDLDAGGFLVALGSVLAGLGLASAAVVRHGLGRRQRLISAEVVGGLGVLLAGVGLVVAEAPVSTTVALLAATVLAVVVAVLTHRAGLAWSAAVLAMGALVNWSALVLVGLARFDTTPTLAEVWSNLAAWPLLAAAAVAVVPASLRVLTPAVRVLFCSAAVALVAFVVTLPAFDESPTVETLVQLAVVALAALSSVRLDRPWRWVVAAPTVAAGLGLFVGATERVGDALEVLLDHEAWSTDATADLVAVPHPWHLPLLLPVATLAVLVAGWVCLRMRSEQGIVPLVAPFGLVALAAAALVPTMYAVPLAPAVVVLLGASLGTLAVGIRGHGLLVRATGYVLATVLATLTLGAATASAVLTALTTGVYALVALLAAHARSEEARGLGNFGFPPAVTAFGWTVFHLADVATPWRTVPILLVLGAWIILRPAITRELAVAAAGAVAVVIGTTTSSGVDQTWLAVDLTLAGVLVNVSALLHPSRRRLGWVGLGLLTLAQWTRMSEVGVSTFEAYTLPLALVLLVVGVVRMLRTDISSASALGPGLVLALAPTLTLVLVDPVSPRAILLGAACLVALAVGGALGWSAPLVAGGAFGLLLVLREAVHAQVLSQWIMIGLVGVVLITIGVTWERRLAELRMATTYVRRLR